MIQAVRLFITFAFVLAGTAAGAAPVRLARMPDFHAGKIAFSYLQLEDRSSARDVLRDLIRRYPKSDEAPQAKAKLQSIG